MYRINLKFAFCSTLIISLLTSCSDGDGLGEIEYNKDIQTAIFDVSCLVACHDPSRVAGLELTSYALLMKGGDHGIVVVAGNAEESPLIWSLEGQKPNGSIVAIMPPTGFPQLSRTEIRIIKDWIDQGAQDN